LETFLGETLSVSFFDFYFEDEKILEREKPLFYFEISVFFWEKAFVCAFSKKGWVMICSKESLSS
jgi:hypothetical protein